MPVYNPPVDLLRAAIESVRRADLSGMGALHRRRLLHRPGGGASARRLRSHRSAHRGRAPHRERAHLGRLELRAGIGVGALGGPVGPRRPVGAACAGPGGVGTGGASRRGDGLQRRGQDRRSGTPARPLLQARLRSACCSRGRTSSAICPSSARTWWTTPGGTARGTRAARTGTSPCGSASSSRRRRSCTSRMSSTTGACTRARRRRSCPPSRTPSTRGAGPWPITSSGPGVAAR